MRNVIIRAWHPLIGALADDCTIRLCPPFSYPPDAAAIVLVSPSLQDLRDEVAAAAECGMDIPFAVISEPYRRLLLEAVFPSVSVVDASSGRAEEDLRAASGRIRRYRKPSFTEREESFLRELPYGLCGKEISSRLGITERSVRRLKERLMAKTGLVSASQLMIYSAFRDPVSTRSSSHSADTE